jgi:hypothetical protein
VLSAIVPAAVIGHLRALETQFAVCRFGPVIAFNVGLAYDFFGTKSESVAQRIVALSKTSSAANRASSESALVRRNHRWLKSHRNHP